MLSFLQDRIRSFSYALRGIKWGKNEPNFVFHLFAATSILCLSWYLNISTMELCLVIFLIAVTLAAELFNTAIEHLCDRITQDQDKLIMKVKDLSAGAVLLIALGDVIIGLIIFWPYLINLVSG